VLNDPRARESLAEAVAGADRLVLLGDVLELRESPLAQALDAAMPTLELLGEAMVGRDVVLVAGNHDHELAGPLLDDVRAKGSLASLGLERIAKAPTRGPVGRIRRALGKAKLSLAYPGVWVRNDVYATHGHYLDCHNTVPTIECLSIAATIRAIGGLPPGRRTPADYEAAVSPTYALTYTVAQAPGPAAKLLAGRTSLEAWKRLNGSAGGRSRLAAKTVRRVLFPGAVAAINRAGLGPFGTDLSGDALRRAGLEGMAATIDSLGIDAGHVVFGHTHRSGPHPGDEGWDLPGGTQLINPGSWIYEPAFLGREPRQSPYWPGHCVWVEETGPPELRRLIT
jgi:predicted phosphodiesterase